jgi:dipeptidyl aminopeptidase/acylaminoacyl peptidase
MREPVRMFVTGALLIGACGGSSPQPAKATLEAPPALIPRAVLFGNPERSAPKLSPDGSHVAFSAPADGVLNVFVAPADDLSHPTQVTFDRARPVLSYDWSADGRYVLYLQDKAGDENFHLHRVGLDGKDAIDLTPGDKVRAQLLGVSYQKPGTIIVGLNARNPELHDVFEVDLATGTSKLEYENPGYVGFVIDDALRVRMAQRMDPDGAVQVMAIDPNGKAKPQDRYEQVDALTTGVLAFDASGQHYYMNDSRDRDTGALFEVDATTGQRTLIAEDAKADAGEVLMHPTTGRVRAVRFERARMEWTIVDPAVAPDLAALAKLDDGDFFIPSMSKDDRRWVVVYAGDDAPVHVYLWDRDAQKGSFLYATRPALEGLPLARMHPVAIAARDGLELTSYLTLPVNADPDGDGKASAPVPMVLLVHGGPWARVSWGYNPLVQLLANRGYAVLNLNFRGSTGFGKGFVNAGDKQWGKKMHDDLLDGVAWAVKQGVTRADTVCIMGGSYGGYATLAGLTLTPTTFKCGVDIVGPSNLETLLASVPPYWKPLLAMFKTRVGDPDTDEGKAILKRASPLTHVAAIARPLLIGQGANDPRVKRAESDQIVAAMQQKGLPVTYVLFPDEGHGFKRPENNLAFTAVAEAFLSVHLGGRVQPLSAADFAGSTMQVLAGREGIPGLPADVGVPPPVTAAP